MTFRDAGNPLFRFLFPLNTGVPLALSVRFGSVYTSDVFAPYRIIVPWLTTLRTHGGKRGGGNGKGGTGGGGGFYSYKCMICVCACVPYVYVQCVCV